MNEENQKNEIMNYTGKLYGKIGGNHFDTGRTTKDWDLMLDALQDFVNAVESNKVILADEYESAKRAIQKANQL